MQRLKVVASLSQGVSVLQALNATPQLLGENLWLVPEEMPSLKGIKFMRPGLHVGVQKNRIEPSYALALAIHEKKAPTVPITLPQWQQYVAVKPSCQEMLVGDFDSR